MIRWKWLLRDFFDEIFKNIALSSWIIEIFKNEEKKEFAKVWNVIFKISLGTIIH